MNIQLTGNRLHRLFKLLILLLIIQSCDSNTSNDEIATVIQGTIENPGDYLIEFVVNDSIYIVDLEEDNSFLFTTTDINEPAEVQFIHGRESGYIYLKPGASLSMNIDHNTLFETATFDGETAPESRFIFDQTVVERNSPDQNSLYRLDESEFLTAIETIRKNKYDRLEKNSSSLTDSAFIRSARGNIYYEWANHMISYPNMHGMLTQNFGFQVSDTINSMIRDIPLERPELLGSYRYINFLFNRISNKVNESMAAVSVAQDEVNQIMLQKSIEITKNMISDQRIRDKIIQEFILYYYTDLDRKTRNKITKEYDYLVNDQFRRKLNRALENGG